MTTVQLPRRHSARVALVCLAALALAACGRTDSTTAAGPGAAAPSTADEIVVAATFPQSGPLAVVGAAGRGLETYLKKVNAAGGVDGKQIVFKAYDDAYDPARMAANARKAVEEDGADVVVSFGGPSLAIRPYLNEKKVFNLVLAGNSAFSDVTTFPYSHAWYPDLGWESQVATSFIAKKSPGAKVGVLGFNNDLTDSQAAGIRAGGLDPVLVLKVPPSQQDVTAQITQLRNRGVDTVFLSVGAGQVIGAVKYMKAVKWSPTVVLYSSTAAKTGAVAPLGDDAKGIYSALWLADPADPLWADSGVAEFKTDVAAHDTVPQDADNALALGGYAAGQALVEAIRKAGSGDADAVNGAWNSLDGVTVAGLPTGTSLKAGPGGRLVYSYQVVQFDGSVWKPQGDLVDVVSAGYTG